MGVAGRRLHLGVPEQLADHRQAFAKRQRSRGERVPQVVNADIRKPRRLAHLVPVVRDMRQPRAASTTRNDPGIAGDARQLRENSPGRRRKRNHSRSRLAVRKPNLVCIEMHVVPPQGGPPSSSRSGRADAPPTATPCTCRTSPPRPTRRGGATPSPSATTARGVDQPRDWVGNQSGGPRYARLSGPEIARAECDCIERADTQAGANAGDCEVERRAAATRTYCRARGRATRAVRPRVGRGGFRARTGRHRGWTPENRERCHKGREYISIIY